ncbi:MAG: WecB/TagA/CpsF family glycosyltransferase [Actinomycetota bacterium]
MVVDESRRPGEPIPTIELLGVRFARLEAPAVLDEIERLYERDEPALVFHANAHTLNLATEDLSYRAVLRRADMVLNDGKGVLLGARLKGSSLPADLNGNYVGPLLLERAARRGWPVFLLGARPGVARRAADELVRRRPGLRVAGTRDGYFTAAEESHVVSQIRASGAGLLLAGLGNPRQERWLERCLEGTGARLGVGVGAFIDFQAGEIARAPAWMNRAGLEWVHRLGLDPRRMWRRYLLGNPLFLARALGDRRASRRGGIGPRSL